MIDKQLADQTPAIQLFGPFQEFYALLTQELAGLDDKQMDFTSTQWEWAAWSIRHQVSHLAAMHLRWLVTRWGDQVLPDGPPPSLDYPNLFADPADRWLDPSRYRGISILLDKIGLALDMLEDVLEERTVGELRQIHIRHPLPGDYWQLMLLAHPDGIRPDPSQPQEYLMNFEATVRHMYFEDVTHLYNIQRLKRAQGLAGAVNVPRAGYWTLEGWDRSEP